MEVLRLSWPGGEHDFRLGLGEIEALQELCDAGPGQVLRRLVAFDLYTYDVKHTLRLGLIGGGMEKAAAQKLVDRMILEQGLGKLNVTAVAALSASLYGPEDDMPGKPTTERTPETGSGASPTSTAPAP